MVKTQTCHLKNTNLSATLVMFGCFFLGGRLVKPQKLGCAVTILEMHVMVPLGQWQFTCRSSRMYQNKEYGVFGSTSIVAFTGGKRVNKKGENR